MLVDAHGRTINYLRLAITDRCNLRCQYCMPEEGIDYVPRQDLMTYEELLRVIRLLAKEGVNKLRITGGEPFLRKNLIDFLAELRQIPQLAQIHLTTNGTLLTKHLDRLSKLRIDSINLSIDSLDRQRFFELTRRDELPTVLAAITSILRKGIPLKTNTVVISKKNEVDILPLVLLAKEHPISVRFIEEMPFNGGDHATLEFWSHRQILAHIKAAYPKIERLPFQPTATAQRYRIPGFKGDIGIIAAYSRTFCGTCNRLRLTPQGGLRTCLYDQGAFNLRDLLRAGATDAELLTAIRSALAHRAEDGHQAEARSRQQSASYFESMATIGG